MNTDGHRCCGTRLMTSTVHLHRSVSFWHLHWHGFRSVSICVHLWFLFSPTAWIRLKRFVAPGKRAKWPRPKSSDGGHEARQLQPRQPAAVSTGSNAGGRGVPSEGGGKSKRHGPQTGLEGDRTSTGGFNPGWKGCSARSHTQTKPRPLRASILSNPLVIRPRSNTSLATHPQCRSRAHSKGHLHLGRAR